MIDFLKKGSRRVDIGKEMRFLIQVDLKTNLRQRTFP